MHVSEESEGMHSPTEIWGATGATFLAKFFFAIIFLAPVLLLELQLAIMASISLGLLLIFGFSCWIALQQKKSWLHMAGEHLLIAVLVIALTYYIGTQIAVIFG